MEFRITTAVLATLGEAVQSLAAGLPRPIRVAASGGGFRWEYPVQSPQVVQLGKAVRMVTAIKGAWLLASEQLTTESAALLRVASDLAAEIDFLSEGLLAGSLNAAQQKFVDDYFKPFPTNPDELAARKTSLQRSTDLHRRPESMRNCTSGSAIT
jgi:hypothetical protein